MINKKALIVQLPYLVSSSVNLTKKSVRSFLAFPYGALTIATFIKKETNHEVNIIDLNIVEESNVESSFRESIIDSSYQVIGFSMSNNQNPPINLICYC